jgi:hypothetical protein
VKETRRECGRPNPRLPWCEDAATRELRWRTRGDLLCVMLACPRCARWLTDFLRAARVNVADNEVRR